MKKSRSVILALSGLIAVALVVLLLVSNLQSKEKTASDAALAESQSQRVVAKGVVESLEEVEIGSRVVGVIQNVAVVEGAKIEKGQLLLEVDDDKIRARMDQAKAMVREARAGLRRVESGYRTEEVAMAEARVRQLAAVYSQARDEFQRQERLYQKEATTLMTRNRAEERMLVAQEDLAGARINVEKLQKGERAEDIESARASLARHIADLNYYEALLKDYAITSPIDGIVAMRLIEPGESVDIGTPLLKVFNPEKLRIRAEVEETDVGKVEVGQIAEVTTDAFPGRVFRGRVDQVFPDVRKKAQKTFDPMASFDIHTQALHVHLDDFEGLRNGMTVTVSFLK